jgi:hypothetical protein
MTDSKKLFFSRDELRESYQEFIEIYKNRPIKNNGGGMGVNNSFALWKIIKELKPKVFVESGVWKGHSTWIVEVAKPDCEIYCFDINYSQLTYKSKTARYVERDFELFNWSSVDLNNSLIMFDDHQNMYERLKSAYFFGFKNVILEDNFPIGEGDAYSLKHIVSGVGATSMQMSRKWAGTFLQRYKRVRKEKVIWNLGRSQSRLVIPNVFDWQNLSNRIDYFFEFPPIYLEHESIWGLPYIGNYASETPLFNEIPIDNLDWSYSFLTFCKLK